MIRRSSLSLERPRAVEPPTMLVPPSTRTLEEFTLFPAEATTVRDVKWDAKFGVQNMISRAKLAGLISDGDVGVNSVMGMYGYIRNHKKTIKNKQTRARERKSTKEAKDAKPKPGKVKKSTSVNYGSTEFGRFTSYDGETIESYCTRFYKMMNEMIRNNLSVATMQVNVQFLQQLQPEWSRFVTIVKKQHKLDEVSYHKLFDILKQYQKEVNELRAERMAKNANPLALVATAQTLQDPYYQSSKPHKSYVQMVCA
ncbi:hypothetical protein Tco_1078323 [Tanacetum coccineum]